MRLLIILFLFLIFSNAQAETVSPTYREKVEPGLQIAAMLFSPNGKKIFLMKYVNGGTLYQYNLNTAFDITSFDDTSEVTLDLNAGSDDVGTGTNGVQGLEFNSDGTKIFATNPVGGMNVHSLSTPYDISNATQDADDGIDWRSYLHGGDNIAAHDIDFNNDGTKMYLFDYNKGQHELVEYDLSTPYLPSSATHNNSLNLETSIGVNYLQELEFDDDGTRMYIINSSINAASNNYVYVYKLSTPFSSSTATHVGKWQVTFTTTSTYGSPLAFQFSSDGMKFFMNTYNVLKTDGASIGLDDYIFEFNLSCPYGIVICEADSISNVGAQVEFAKHVIQQNTSTVFKRFEWLRRNESKNNLNSNNINLNIYNPVLSSLKKQLKSSFNERKYSQVSLVETKNTKSKNKNWSYWSHGDISFGRKGDTATSKPNEIRVSGLMFGADKKINNNKFFGAAIRFGKGEIENISPNGIELDTESLTLNLYSTLPVNNNSNLNALVGVSLLRIDQLLSNEITGERNGKQVFTALNLESKDSYGNFNIRPTGKFEFGVTQFSEYTDFGTSSTNSQDTYDSLTFKTGNIAAGFKFDNFIDINDGRLSRNGSLEYIRDLTSNIDYNFKNNSDNVSVTKTAETHSIHNIKGNLGFEILYESGYTFALNYERFQGLDYSSHQDSIFFKFGHIREEESEFAFNYKPLQNNQMELSYVKDVNGFDIKVSSNYSMESQIPDYGANIEVSRTF